MKLRLFIVASILFYGTEIPASGGSGNAMHFLDASRMIADKIESSFETVERVDRSGDTIALYLFADDYARVKKYFTPDSSVSRGPVAWMQSIDIEVNDTNARHAVLRIMFTNKNGCLLPQNRRPPAQVQSLINGNRFAGKRFPVIMRKGGNRPQSAMNGLGGAGRIADNALYEAPAPVSAAGEQGKKTRDSAQSIPDSMASDGKNRIAALQTDDANPNVPQIRPAPFSAASSGLNNFGLSRPMQQPTVDFSSFNAKAPAGPNPFASAGNNFADKLYNSLNSSKSPEEYAVLKRLKEAASKQ